MDVCYGELTNVGGSKLRRDYNNLIHYTFSVCVNPVKKNVPAASDFAAFYEISDAQSAHDTTI